MITEPFTALIRLEHRSTYNLYCIMVMCIGVRGQFRLRGHTIFCPNCVSLPEKSNMFEQCIFVAHAMGGGGGGGCLEEEIYYSF